MVGDTVTITTVQGTVGDVTDNGDGTYTATYTAPELVLAEDYDGYHHHPLDEHRGDHDHRRNPYSRADAR